MEESTLGIEVVADPSKELVATSVQTFGQSSDLTLRPSSNELQFHAVVVSMDDTKVQPVPKKSMEPVQEKILSVQKTVATSFSKMNANEDGDTVDNVNEEIVSKIADLEKVELQDDVVYKRLTSAEFSLDTTLTDVGAIDLAFPENPDPHFIDVECFPLSYYTLTAKERLLLVFAENFRRQFVASPHYAGRRPLVLAIKNECDVQKFVCTTIRPTSFLFTDLITNLEGCASFVADFIIYEHLENPLCLPPRLISPDTLLIRRRGNSYEIATLLCSMLIGAGFAAVVVSGSATVETTLNDQRRVVFLDVPNDVLEEDNSAISTSKNNYELKEPPDLRSKFVLEMEEKAAQKELEEEERRLLEEREKSEELARKPPDLFAGRRMHAWVAVIENAPWCHKPTEKILNEDGDEITPEPTAFFIEPSTGFRHEVSSSSYLRIDSVWNQHNYYINRQEPTENGLNDMKWDLSNCDDWEHFLPGEPYELRKRQSSSQELDTGNQDILLIEKHLDVLPSWVQKLHIGFKDYEERFPNNEKSIFYKKAIYQRFSVYFNYDGLIKKLTIFEDLEYSKPVVRWEWYANRVDNLDMIKIDFSTKKIEESFLKGRPDSLKYFIHSAELNQPKIFHFYHYPRVDCLKRMEVNKDRFYFHFESRKDLCYYQEFQIKLKDHIRCHAKALVQIIEKYDHNKNVPSCKDIAIRQFLLNQNKIFLKFQFAKDAITASTREFIKPPKPDYGEDIVFDPVNTSGYNANPLDDPPTQVELYYLLLEQLKREEVLKKTFEKRCVEVDELLTRRKTEMLNPRLMFSVFDPLRNEGARIIRLEEYEENRLRKELAQLQDPDFLAPYLVLYEKRKPTYDESWAAYNACLNDVKSRYIGLLSELQRRYEDLTTEAKALKKFLGKFQDQFDDFDYERLVKESKDIELNKRMVQQRLILTHEEAQRKYEKIKESLLHDERLNLKKGMSFN